MRRPLGSRLLRGAATTAARITAIAALLAAATAAPLAAQSAAANQLAKPSLNIAITYTASRANQIPSSSFWMQGGGLQIEGRFYHGLGAVADVTSLHVANINSTGVGLDLVTATFGPRYTWSSKRYEFYAQALAGDATGLNSIFPSSTSANTTATSMAIKAGGGINVLFTPHLALRAIEADWTRHQFPNSTTNAQDSFNLAAGVVFRFR